MSALPQIVQLAQEISKLKGQQIDLSRNKHLTLKYVETCHSFKVRNQILLEFKTNEPVSLNERYFSIIADFCVTIGLKAYDAVSNFRDQVYVYTTVLKPRSPLAVVRAIPAPITPTNETPMGTTLENNSAVYKSSFNGKEIFKPIVFVPSSDGPLLPSRSTLASDNKEVKLDITDSSGTAIECDYSGPQFQLKPLTNNENFTRLRKYLAFFIQEKPNNLFLESDSYLSLKVYLTNEGLPNDDEKMKELYYYFLTEKGFTKQQIDEDLRKLKLHLDNNHMIRSNQVKHNFNMFYNINNAGNRAFYTTQRPSSHLTGGHGTPHQCIVV